MSRFLILLLAGSTLLFAGQWEKLGSRKVKLRAEQDTIMVTASEGRFKKIAFRVSDNGIRLLDVKIHYGDGSVHDVKLRQFIAAGEQSRVIDLPGNRRIIKKVVFWYKTRGSGPRTRATVSLWGKR